MTSIINKPDNQVATSKPLGIKGLLESEGIKSRFQEILKDKAPGFISSVLNVVNGSTNLAKAEPMSIIMSAAIAASLDLPINPNLGFAYIIPYKTTGTDDNGQRYEKYVAQFQMGYKGFIQLALRTGQYEKINAKEVRAGQLIKNDPFEEEYEFDWSVEGGEIIGYAAMFKLKTGFKKTIYWNVGKMMDHAKKHSKSFNDPGGPWKTNTYEMSFKTLIKYILSKFGVLSIEMQKAFNTDQAVIKNEKTEEIEYVDANEGEAKPLTDDQKKMYAETLNKTEEAEHTEVSSTQNPTNNLPDSKDL